jgi:hypothetical protein
MFWYQNLMSVKNRNNNEINANDETREQRQSRRMFIEKHDTTRHSTLARVAPSLYNLRFYKHTNPRGWEKHKITKYFIHVQS